MGKFSSLLAPEIETFIRFREASGRWNSQDGQKIKFFDSYCAQQYPDSSELTQEMVDNWCKKKETEKNNSCRSRTYPVLGFVRFMRERGKTNIKDPLLPALEKCTYIPHAFTKSELERFFNACDNLPSNKALCIRLRKITVPVFFRLLYSAGLRTCEARLLMVKDVNLDQGVLSISKSKGASHHFVVLHDSMLGLMKKYDEAARALMPEREYFFSSSQNTHYNNKWVDWNFRALWDKCNRSYANPYALRHNYAIVNINQWIGLGFNFDSKLLYLSKSMGHAILDSTRYYYSFVPALADILNDLSGQNFDDIVPEVRND